MPDDMIAERYRLTRRLGTGGMSTVRLAFDTNLERQVAVKLLAELCFDAQPERVCLIGHSHVALAFMREEGKPATGEACPQGTALDLSEAEWLVNPGSVGQPRDGDPRAGWLVLDTAAWTASYRRTPYDIAAAAAAIRAARLPDSLAERLEYGQ